MGLFPYYDYLLNEGVFTKEQLRWIAVTQYLMIATCVATLAWICYNIVTILYRQRKHRVIPLVNFYALATMLVLFRMVFQVILFLGLS